MKNSTAAGLLALFLGEFGIHWFYVGKSGRGVVYLLLFLFGLLTSGIIIGFLLILIVGVLSLIDSIRFFMMDDYDFQQLCEGSGYRPQNNQPQIVYVERPQITQPVHASIEQVKEASEIDNYTFCVNCGAKQPIGQKFCTECGAVLDAKTAATASQNIVKEDTTAMIQCPGCGSMQPADTEFCPECGTTISPKESTESKESSNSSASDKIALLKELKELLDAGILTQEEFNAQKAQLLKQ